MISHQNILKGSKLLKISKTETRRFLIENIDLIEESDDNVWISKYEKFKEINVEKEKEKDLEKRKGIIYVARCDVIYADHVYKIGRTTNLENRIQTLNYNFLGENSWKSKAKKFRTSSELSFYPVLTWNVNDSFQAEVELFQIVDKYRQVGELFLISLEELLNLTKNFYSNELVNWIELYENFEKTNQFNISDIWKIAFCKKYVDLFQKSSFKRNEMLKELTPSARTVVKTLLKQNRICTYCNDEPLSVPEAHENRECPELRNNPNIHPNMRQYI